jgi:hypothetical protein
MNYKSIFKAVGVVSVAAVFSIGCGGNDDDDGNGGDGGGGGGSGGLVGDWSIVEMTSGQGEFEPIPDDRKAFYSFKSSNNLVTTTFNKISDFWIESTQFEEKYNIKGDSICVDGECTKYSISGNTLTLSTSGQRCYDDVSGEQCYSYSSSVKAVRDNLANTKKSLGKVYSQDPALNATQWESENGYIYLGRLVSVYAYDIIFSYGLSGDYDGVVWYTEGSRFTLVGLGCAEYETVKDDDGYEWERCVSYSTAKTVTLDYELTNDGNLRLRQTGGDWDVWTPRSDDNYMYKTRLKSKEGKYAIIPFFKDFRR